MKPNPTKIILIAGARPNFMKVAPVLARMKQYPDRFAPLLCHTGQHYDHNMSDVFFRDLGMGEPDIHLGVGSGTHAQQTAAIMTAFEKVVEQHHPDWILVVGDVNSTVACSMVAAKTGVKIAHLEAGLRSFDRTMPEEINRVLTDRISDLLLIPSPDARENLLREGVAKEKIAFVGNIMIESLIQAEKQIAGSGIHDKLSLTPGSYALLTLHRPSNVDSRQEFISILEAVSYVGAHVPVVFPAHPRTKKMMNEFGVSQNGFKLIDPVGYHDFLALQKDARLVLTDSGGIQEETTFFQVPCLTIRNNTERPVTITEGTNILVGTDPENILRRAEAVIGGEVKDGKVPERWDGEVSERVVEALGES